MWAAELTKARQEWLEQDPRVRSAAIIARTFRLDPVAVLDEPDRGRAMLRAAAHNLIARLEKG